MFTGIIKHIGVIKKNEVLTKGKRFYIYAENEVLNKLEKGFTSVSVNGACHTIEDINKDEFIIFSSFETLNKTNLKFLKNNDYVNLELPLTMSTFLDGHLILGHVDGLGKINKIKQIGYSYLFNFEIEASLAKYLVEKDSIAIDGISLTIFNIENNKFEVAIIPQTINHTNLKFKKENDYVNIEINIFAKYSYKYLKENKIEKENKFIEFLKS